MVNTGRGPLTSGKSVVSLTLRLFLFISVPLLLIVTGVSLAYYFSAQNANIRVMKNQASFRISLQSDAFRHEFQSIVSDLVVLSAHHQLRLIADGTGQADYDSLANELFAFCLNKKMYDQVRFLDATGMERIRVNFNHGHPVIVPANELQSKGGRYYFEDTFNLAQGEVFVSPLDLNVEGGAIEQPLKPMIRFGLPVFNSKGDKTGILLLNYFGARIIDAIDKVARESTVLGFGMLLNSDGYFFRGMRDEDEWGFMLPGRQDRTFSHLFPAQWDQVARDSSGQFLDEKGLFTFTTVWPLLEGLKSSSGSPDVSGQSIKALGADHYRWKIVSFMPRDEISASTGQLRTVLIASNAFFALFSSLGLWILAGAITRRRAVEGENDHMAHFDLLTELPNRQMLYDRMKMALASAKRDEKQLSVFFLDLDGFKLVNDSLGHDAGDQVLIEVADRLQDCVRESDTVARLGGDEFVLLLTSSANPEDLGRIATKIIQALSEPIIFSGQSCSVGASIGIASYPKDGDTQDALLCKADAAMYVAKESGKNTYRFSV